MYEIIPTSKFRKSLRKIKRSDKFDVLEIKRIVKIIASGKKLDSRFKEHKLHGKLSNFRECHIKADLLLLYKKDRKNLILVLVDIGRHDNLF